VNILGNISLITKKGTIKFPKLGDASRVKVGKDLMGGRRNYLLK